MKLSKARVFIIRKLIEANEKFFFERKLKNFYKKHLKLKPKIVIDVGANRGQTIEFFLKLNPTCFILAFEPIPRLCNLLRKKFKQHKNVKIICKGISNEEGIKIFYENIFDATSTLEELNPDSEYLKKKAKILGVDPTKIISSKYPIEVTTLAKAIKELLPQREIDVIKIDTEGHEIPCLKGLFKDTYIHKIHPSRMAQ